MNPAPTVNPASELPPKLVPVARLLCRCACAIWAGEIAPPWPIVPECKRPENETRAAAAMAASVFRERAKARQNLAPTVPP